VLAFAVLWLLTAPVATEPPAPPRVGILPVVGGQGLSEADRDHLRDRSRAALLGPWVRVADHAEVAEAEACEDAACRRRTLAAHGVAYWLTTRLRGRDRMYVVHTALWSVDAPDAVAHAEDRCVVCGRVELAELVAAQTLTMRHFLTETGDDPAAFVVDARPRSAHVEVDGTDVGTGRVSTRVSPGEHRIRVSARGYDPQELTLSVTRGVTRLVEVRLTHPERPQQLHRPLAIGGLATAAVGIGVGAALVAAHGRAVARRCGPDDPQSFDVDGDCRYVHETLGAGVALTALGVGLAGAAMTLLLVDASRRKRHRNAWAHRPSLRVSLGRMGVGLAF
jgi:PEGA domain